MEVKRVRIFLCFILWLIYGGQGHGQSRIAESRHNLSARSTAGTVKATSESQLCIFCHTPHRGQSNAKAPLWSKKDRGSVYIPYNGDPANISSTLNAAPGQPDGSSILCLSCHDGTIALGEVASSRANIDFSGVGQFMPTGSRGYLGTDLSDDHPISFTYNDALAAADNNLRTPGTISGPVSLESGKVQCVSCHSSHDNTNGKFLHVTKDYSALCLSCHDREVNDGWSSSAHSASTQQWNNAGASPWAHIETPGVSVALNACENCHDPHNAAGKVRLLKAPTEEGNCLDCHNGNASATNIASQITKMYAHDVTATLGVHDPLEATIPAQSHVECQDCHNPHSANGDTPVDGAPLASGALLNVKGIDLNGSPVDRITNEYELCFRCHANDGATTPVTNRIFTQVTIREEFATASKASFHPVVYPGQNTTDVPSLLPPYTVASQIYCSDCHSSDGPGAPKGPHGSTEPQMLSAFYNRAEYTNLGNAAWSTAYVLCSKCHDVDNLGAPHDVEGGHMLEYTSCNTCHDPHASDQPYLLNYDPSVISENTAGDQFFNTQSNTCNLICHPPGHRKSYNHIENY